LFWASGLEFFSGRKTALLSCARTALGCRVRACGCGVLSGASRAACPAPGQQQLQQPDVNPPQAAPIIERIEFQGNRRIRSETLRARIFSRVGDPLNEDALRRDFHALWNTQYFEDIRLEVQDSPDKPGQKIVIFYLTERPIIRRIEYKGNKSSPNPTSWNGSRIAKSVYRSKASSIPRKSRKPKSS